jgi:imidazole glycerol-phosphate synthase subunit HisH
VLIAVINYGLGNIRSVAKALELVGADVKVTNSAKDIANAKAVVFPGVGAFSSGMENLKKLDILSALIESINKGVPFLGLCLGLQLLFSESHEHGLHKGFDIIKGKVKKFNTDVKIPHMGWNQVRQVTVPQGHKSQSVDLFKGIPDNSYFYFVHSYYVEPEDKNVIAATTDYGAEFSSVVCKDNVIGLQFHPEKSSDLGLKILRNFVNIC